MRLFFKYILITIIVNISVNTVLTHKQRAKNELKNYIQYFALCMAIFLKKNEDPM